MPSALVGKMSLAVTAAKELGWSRDARRRRFSMNREAGGGVYFISGNGNERKQSPADLEPVNPRSATTLIFMDGDVQVDAGVDEVGGGGATRLSAGMVGLWSGRGLRNHA